MNKLGLLCVAYIVHQIRSAMYDSKGPIAFVLQEIMQMYHLDSALNVEIKANAPNQAQQVSFALLNRR